MVNDLADASNFELIQDAVCEFRPYTSCAPFSAVHEYTDTPQGFSVFPNPARAGSPISLRWEGTDVEQVNILDVHGNLVRQHFPVPGADNLDVRIESVGIYWVYLRSRTGSKAEKVIVLQK